jgi:cytochrome c oxidase assembly protein subunit 15
MSKNPRTKTAVEVYGLPVWYVSAFGWLVAAVLGLIALGGSVRIMNAGLACPDWPLCFGDVIPDYHPQVYFEFMHRVVAGLVAIAAVSLQLVLFRSRAPRSLKWLAAGTLLLLASQIIMGGLTVLLQLHSKVVAAHLGMGTGFFALLVWQYLSLRGSDWKPAPALISPSAKRWSIFLAASVYGQIILGGLVASHFASLVCTDFPTCHGEWFPTFSGIIGLHVIHRLGAYSIFGLALVNLIWMWRKQPVNKTSLWIFGLVCAQVAIGIANVLLFTPPLIAVAHLAVATTILGFATKQLYLCMTAPSRFA